MTKPQIIDASSRSRFVLLLLAAVVFATESPAADQPQWGQRHSRNMVSEETNLPTDFDPQTGRNVKWVASLGTESYATPVIAGGRVICGANNGRPRDPRHEGRRGVLLCLDETTGKLCWQLVVPRFEHQIYLDWSGGGICSPAAVEGDRVYAVTNRAEVVCLDIKGMANGNDGPFRSEGRHMTPAGEPPLEVTDFDADVLWLFDMPSGAGVHYHDSSHSSILIDGDYLYLNTGNGVNRTHSTSPSPDGPSLIALDKRTGRLVGRDREGIGPKIFHCTWSSPAMGTVDGRRLVFFGGGDGVCYAFDALKPGAAALDDPVTLNRVWRFDCDPTAPKENIRSYMRNRRESPSNIKGMPVYHEGRVYVAAGGDIWWGKDASALLCIDATKTGDVTETGRIWSYPMDGHCCATPSIHEGLVYIGDCDRMLHCIDAATGKACWTHELEGNLWAGTLVADGKVYAGTLRGELLVFEAGRQKRLLASVQLDAPVYGTPVAANGVLYVPTRRDLFAIEKQAE